MAEDKQIAVKTTLSVVGTSLSILSVYDSSILQDFFIAFIADSDKVVNNITFKEGMLGYTKIGYDSVVLNLNDEGELLITDLFGDVDRFSIDDEGNLIETI